MKGIIEKRDGVAYNDDGLRDALGNIMGGKLTMGAMLEALVKSIERLNNRVGALETQLK